MKKQFDIVEARDLLWRALHETKQNLVKQRSALNLETAYLELYVHHPEIRLIFNDAIRDAKASDEAVFSDLLLGTQNEVCLWSDRKKEYETALLWNKLVALNDKYLEEFHKHLEEIYTPIIEMLNKLARMTDEELLRKPNIQNLLNANYTLNRTSVSETALPGNPADGTG